jgi:hypothetical protein
MTSVSVDLSGLDSYWIKSWKQAVLVTKRGLTRGFVSRPDPWSRVDDRNREAVEWLDLTSSC